MPFILQMFLYYLLLISQINPLIASTSVQDYSAKRRHSDQLKRLYGYIYWENGSPQKKISRRPKSWVNPEMAMNPDIVFQTGFYNVRFEADTFQLTGYQHSPGSDYLSALTEDAIFFPDVQAQLILSLKVMQAGGLVEFKAKTAVVETETNLNIRLIENGRYVQRVDHTGIVFENSLGEALGESAYFEITSWPNQLVLTLDFSETSLQVVESSIKVISPSGKVHSKKVEGSKLSLAISPHLDATLGGPKASITQAYERQTNTPLLVEFDEAYQAHRIDFPMKNTSDLYKVEEFVFEIENASSNFEYIPIVFNQTERFKWITGTVMALTDLEGRSTGIPIQVSKNWHKSYPTKHSGTWLRGSTMVPVNANSRRKLVLKVIAGYWDQAASASHSQLSLIGWNKYSWKWDQSALGAWGESMTFDPGQKVAAAFIADVRPTFTTPTNGSADHGWTENVGGGDFLKYFDRDNKYRWAKKLKTAYNWTGPNMTEVLYSGVTDNDSIRFTYKTQLVRANDYHRRFNHFKYEILKNIEPQRLVFYQLAADYYMLPEFEYYHHGNEFKVNRLKPRRGGNEYHDQITFNNHWIAIDDLNSGSNDAKSTRGIIWRSSQINGMDFKLYAHIYGRTWGRSTSLFDFSGPSFMRYYRAGDVIEGEIEYIMPANSRESYWGYDRDFAHRLSESSHAWNLVQQEFSHNNFNVTVAGAKVLKNYPVDVEAIGPDLDVQISVPGTKGIGHIPVIVRNVGAHKTVYAYVYKDGHWLPASENEANFLNHSYYQATINKNGKKDYVFNVKRPDSYPFAES